VSCKFYTLHINPNKQLICNTAGERTCPKKTKMPLDDLIPLSNCFTRVEEAHAELASVPHPSACVPHPRRCTLPARAPGTAACTRRPARARRGRWRRALPPRVWDDALHAPPARASGTTAGTLHVLPAHASGTAAPPAAPCTRSPRSSLRASTPAPPSALLLPPLIVVGEQLLHPFVFVVRFHCYCTTLSHLATRVV